MNSEVTYDTMVLGEASGETNFSQLFSLKTFDREVSKTLAFDLYINVLFIFLF